MQQININESSEMLRATDNTGWHWISNDWPDHSPSLPLC